MPQQKFELKTSSHLETVFEPSNDPWQVELKDSATSVMTDFTMRSMFKVEPDESIDEALQKMKIAGLRIAFVKEKGAEKLLGAITSYDIMGEKPVRYLQNVSFSDHSGSRKDIRVRDIMEQTTDWVVADMHDVEKATVQNILETLQKLGRTHLPVVETKSGAPRLRGLFSSAKILRLTEISRQRAAQAK